MADPSDLARFVEAQQSGFGVGLALAKQAADAHGGTIRIQNLAREGLRVRARAAGRDGAAHGGSMAVGLAERLGFRHVVSLEGGRAR